MPVDRKIFKVPFFKKSPPEWICPTCNKGILAGKKGSFTEQETIKSLKNREDSNWEPEWVSSVYSCQFLCTNPLCAETVFNVGVGRVESDYISDGGEYGEIYTEVFEPKFFIPHLNIFRIPHNTPDDIKLSINKSFELFFVNPSSSANHLRMAIEQLLDFFKVKRFGVKKGRKYIMTLHRRIELLPKKILEFKDLMLAIKLLGNDGSHPKGVNKDDVMDACDLIESILEDIFDNKKERTKKLAKKINGHRTKKSLLVDLTQRNY